jgi:TonB family protein
MKRTITSALLASAGLSAASVGGYIHDAKGAAIADAKVSLYSPDTSARQEALTGSDGKFGVSLDEGQYILRVEKAGFASIFRVFDLRPDSKVDRDFTMAAEGSAAVADVLVIPSEPQTKRVRIGGKVAQSNLVMRIQPIYPVAAKQAGVQGVVELAVTISKDGVPQDLRVVSSPSDDLSESAVEAIRQWRYRPTLLNGQPVEIDTSVMVNYTLVK